MRIIANLRKIMANTGFQKNENYRKKKYKITKKQNVSANMRSVFRKFKQERLLDQRLFGGMLL